MAVKIRLARKGRKKKAFYHIVVADSRSPRDGRYIEKIGSYNPITNPATIELDFDKALGWLQNGALPTDTCRSILSYKGVLIKKHLLEGVKKGAFDDAEATKRFEEWMKQADAKIEAKKSGLEKSFDDLVGGRLEIEKRINEARIAKLAKKKADILAKENAAARAIVEPEEDVAEESEAPAEEETEALAEEIEAPAEEETEAPAEETEAPAEEETKAPDVNESSPEETIEDKTQE